MISSSKSTQRRRDYCLSDCIIKLIELKEELKSIKRRDNAKSSKRNGLVINVETRETWRLEESERGERSRGVSVETGSSSLLFFFFFFLRFFFFFLSFCFFVFFFRLLL